MSREVKLLKAVPTGKFIVKNTSFQDATIFVNGKYINILGNTEIVVDSKPTQITKGVLVSRQITLNERRRRTAAEIEAEEKAEEN
jgi:hypothetical protein